jgi:hypothetical protein
MHFPICDHKLCLHFSCSTYVLMSFVECFRKHDTFCQFVTKRGSKYGEMIGWLDILVLSPNCQRGSLLVFLLAQLGSKIHRLLYMGSNTSIE